VRRIPFALTGPLRLPHIDRPSTLIESSLQKSNLDSPRVSEVPRHENLSFTMILNGLPPIAHPRQTCCGQPGSLHRRNTANRVRASEKLHIAGLLHLRVM
jgi:hypothetical protein